MLEKARSIRKDREKAWAQACQLWEEAVSDIEKALRHSPLDRQAAPIQKWRKDFLLRDRTLRQCQDIATRQGTYETQAGRTVPNRHKPLSPDAAVSRRLNWFGDYGEFGDGEVSCFAGERLCYVLPFTASINAMTMRHQALSWERRAIAQPCLEPCLEPFGCCPGVSRLFARFPLCLDSRPPPPSAVP